MEKWIERRMLIVCPICGEPIRISGQQRHVEAMHWTAPDDFLRKWKATEKYIKSSLEERYYKHRPNKNQYRFLIDDDATVLAKYYQKKRDAKERNIMFVLTFEEYCKLIYDAGIKTSDIGWGKTSNGNHYVLARYHDIGPYSVGNCRFIPQSQNMYEARINSKARRGIHTKNNGESYLPGNYGNKDIDMKKAAEFNEISKGCDSLQDDNDLDGRPSKKDLISDLQKSSMSGVGRKYGVTMSTIAKWCDHYRIPHYSAYTNEYKDFVNDDGKVIDKLYKKKCKIRKTGVEFTITPKEFCKLLYENNLKSSDLGLYSIIRIDSSKPYTIDNCKFVKN